MALTYKDRAISEAKSLCEEWAPQPVAKEATITDLAEENRQSLQSLIERMEGLIVRIGIVEPRPEKVESGNPPRMRLVDSCNQTRKLLDEAFDLMGQLERIA